MTRPPQQPMHESALSLVTIGDPRCAILRERCHPVPKEMLGQVVAWARDMNKLIDFHEGIGLAANQVGLPWRFFVENVDRPKPMMFVNPEIIETWGDPVDYREGCLSCPGVGVNLPRHETVRMRFTTLGGRVVSDNASGLRARCWQHEIDHLDGKLILDHKELT